MLKMDFAIARLNHQVWKMRLRSFLNDKEEMSEAEAVSHTDCDLGKWIYAIGMKQYQAIPEMAQLEHKHADLHKYIKQVIAYKKAGHIEQANAAFKEVGPLSTDIVALLTTLESKVKQTELVV